MASVFVAGGTGFIGSVLTRELVSRGLSVSVLARSGASADAARSLGAEPVQGDLGREARPRAIPVWLIRLLVGSVVTDSLLSDARLSNARLRALGFELEFPTIDEGIPDVVAGAVPRAEGPAVASGTV